MDECSESQHLPDLPQPLLEMVLVPNTSAKDKKSLRQTCKLFRQLLDDSLVCFNLTTCIYEPVLHKLLQRVQAVPRLGTMALPTKHNMEPLLQTLPFSLTTLSIQGCYFNREIDFKDVGGLMCLTNLYLGGSIAEKIIGFEYISGLTRLECGDNLLGPLTSLAPTLKHLVLWDYNDVQDMHQLTNLEVLSVRYGMPANFFEFNGHLPLKHLCPTSPTEGAERFYTPESWSSAPTTLTGLTLHNVDQIPLGVLPATITHLQLMHPWATDIKQATTALPELKSLDLYQFRIDCSLASFTFTTKLSNLQFLGLYADERQRKIVLPYLPGIVLAAARGVEVKYLENDSAFMNVPYAIGCKPPISTAWASHA